MVLPNHTYCGISHLNKVQTLIDKSNVLHERACPIIGSDKSLSIKSPETVIRSRALVTVRKCIERGICNNFRNYFEINQLTKSTRNSKKLLKVPNLKLKFCRGSFCYSGAKLYKELPREIRQLDLLKFQAQCLIWINLIFSLFHLFIVLNFAIKLSLNTYRYLTLTTANIFF